jgi:hypothetical protein
MNSSIFIGLALVAVAILGCASAVSERPATGSLRHVVLLKFKDDAKAEDVRHVESEFRALKSRIPSVQALEWGTNVSPENLTQGYTHCFFVTFASEKDRDAYLPHQAHKDFVTILRPQLDKVLVIDYIAKD